MLINTAKFKSISYNEGEAIWISAKDGILPFDFDVEEDITKNVQSMDIVCSFLDDVDSLTEKAINYLKATLEKEQASEDDGVVKFYLEFHRDELGLEYLQKMLPDSDVKNISLLEMIDKLKMIRFGSIIDTYTNEQVFIMDFSLNKEFSDELLIVYFKTNKELLKISHES